MKKRVFSVIFSIFILSVIHFNFVSAEPENISVEVNGVPLELDVAPIIENGRTLVPVRAICEALGLTVWYYDDSSVNIIDMHSCNEFDFIFNESYMLLYGKRKSIDTAPQIINDRTMVPIRALSEAIEADVIWDAKNKKICISTGKFKHKIRGVANSRKFYTADGKNYLNVDYIYPVIVNEDSNGDIDKINSILQADAEKFIYNEKENRLEGLKSMWEFQPFETFYSFAVHTDNSRLLSISYYNFGTPLGSAGIFPFQISKTFDFKTGKELQLSDILKGNDNEINKIVYDEFSFIRTSDGRKLYGAMGDKESSLLAEQCRDVKFYVKNNALILYFEPWQIINGGEESIIPYYEPIFKLDIS